MLRAALYARFSSDRQSDRSIGDQFAMCRELAERIGATVVDEHSDAAISGTQFAGRPGLQALLENARAGAYDVIIAEALDRLSRDQEDIAGLYKRLTFASAKIHTVAEGEVSELHIGLKGTMNALFLKDLGEKTRRGQIGVVAEGRSTAPPSFGYRVVRKLGPDGEPIRGLREIDPEQAVIVQRIFEEYASGRGVHEIISRLNSEAAPAPRGGLWTPNAVTGNAVEGTGILHNELYIGRLIYGKRAYVRDPETRKRRKRLLPREQWRVTDVPELRIIDDDLWHRAHATRREVASKPLQHRRRSPHPFSGLVHCGVCGAPYRHQYRGKLVCKTRAFGGDCSNGRTVSLTRLEQRIWNGVRHYLTNSKIVEHYVRVYVESVKEMRVAAADKKTRLEEELGTLDRQIDAYLDQIGNGLASGAAGALIKDRLETAANRREEVRALLQSIKPANVVEFHPSQAAVYARMVEDMIGRIEDFDEEATAATRNNHNRELARTIETILVHPLPKRGHVEIEVRGDLASLLRLSQGEPDKAFSMIVMGAGARTNPCHASPQYEFRVRSAGYRRAG